MMMAGNSSSGEKVEMYRMEPLQKYIYLQLFGFEKKVKRRRCKKVRTLDSRLKYFVISLIW